MVNAMVTCEVELTASWSASMVCSREESTKVNPRAESWNTARICDEDDDDFQAGSPGEVDLVSV